VSVASQEVRPSGAKGTRRDRAVERRHARIETQGRIDMAMTPRAVSPRRSGAIRQQERGEGIRASVTKLRQHLRRPQEAARRAGRQRQGHHQELTGRACTRARGPQIEQTETPDPPSLIGDHRGSGANPTRTTSRHAVGSISRAASAAPRSRAGGNAMFGHQSRRGSRREAPGLLVSKSPICPVATFLR